MSRLWLSISYKVAVVAAVVLIAVSLYDLLRQRPYNVIVLTVDSVRTADFTPDTAPTFFAAMKEARSPRIHRAVSAWTAPNIIAILSGIDPFAQGVHARGHSLPAQRVTPMEDLQAQGWTVGNVQAFALVDVFRNLGVPVNTEQQWRSWLAGRIRGQEPFVFWHHYLDVHLPYSPLTGEDPRETVGNTPTQRARLDVVRTRSAIPVGSVAFESADRPLVHGLYRDGIRQFDDWFAEFWAFFRESGLRENTIVVFTADHGEEILERGRIGHASTTRDASLHEEIVDVPLYVLLPPGHPLAESDWPGLKGETDHLDVMPTVMALIGATPSTPLAGRDLTRSGVTRPWKGYSSRGGYSEPDPENVTRFLAASKVGPCKYVVALHDGRIASEQLYDLQADRGERVNLLDDAAHDCQSGITQDARRRLVMEVLTARVFEPAAEVAHGGSSFPPTLTWPRTEGPLGYDDLQGRFAIEWQGDSAARYVLAYEIGTPPFSLAGEMRIQGTRKDFGEIDRHYWDTWVVPYGAVRVKLRAEGAQGWGEWQTIRFKH